MRRLYVALLALALFAVTANCANRTYVAIDLGSKGTKAMLYSFRDGVPDVLAEQTINTKLMSSMSENHFTPAGIDDAANAAKQLIADLKAKAAARNISNVDVYILGSSGVAKAENRNDLVAAVKAATGVEMQFVDVRQEGYFGLITAVPRQRRSGAVLVDVGSGNTKLGCLVGDAALTNFRPAEIPYGSVSGRNAALKKNASDYATGVHQVVSDDVRPAFSKESMDTPCLRNRRLIYWTGGAAWATVTFTHPESALYGFVKVTRKDLERFLGSLADGSWNQKGLVYHFPSDTSEEAQRKIRARAEKERESVLNVFSREDLMSGVSIMKAVLEESNPSADIYFARNSNYIFGYAREKYQEKD